MTQTLFFYNHCLMFNARLNTFECKLYGLPQSQMVKFSQETQDQRWKWETRFS